ncbi:MAG TPA: hypothetical protein VGC71_16150 [Gaiellales bacterium]
MPAPLIGTTPSALEHSKAGQQSSRPRRPWGQLPANPVLLERGRHPGGVVDVSGG